MNWWWNDRRPSIVKTIDLFKKSLPLKLTSPSAIDREEAKSIVRDLELYESLIKEIDAAFNKTKKPRAPYCPYNGCNTIRRTRLSVSIQCSCNKTFIHHSYNPYCHICHKCFYCNRVVKTKYGLKASKAASPHCVPL